MSPGRGRTGGGAGRGGGAGGRGGGRGDRDRAGRSRGQGNPAPRSGRGRPSDQSRGRSQPPGGKAGRGAAPIRPKADKGLGGDQVEGRQAVRELLLAGTRRAHEVLLAADLDDADILDDIRDLASELRVPLREVTRAKLDAQARTDAPQGVLAMAAPLPEHDLDDLVAPKGNVPPFLVALDGVTDPGNLGAVLRSAECAGVTGVVLPRHRSVHVTPAVTKAAAGAVERIRMALVGGLPTAMTRLREQGVWVVGLDAAGDRNLWDLAVATEPVCLVLGAEGEGLSRLVRERCDQVVGIPLQGRLASLNVAAAGALATFEVARRRWAAASKSE